MGEEENFTVDPMNGRILLLARRGKENKSEEHKIEVVLEKME